MNVPQLRFDGFDREWEVKKLNEIAEISSGGTPNRKKGEYWNGNIPWVTTSEVKFNNIFEAKEYITDKGLKESSAKLFPMDTILVAMYGQGQTRGKSAVLKITAATNQACAAIKVEKNFESQLIYQLLSYKYNELRDLSNDGSQKNLSLGLLSSFKLIVPSLKEEQRKIARFMNYLDQKIKKQEEKIEQLEQFKKGMMQKVFSQELRFKDEDGGEFPEWETKQLKEFATKTVKKNKDMKVTNVISNSAKQGLISQRSYFKKDIANELNIDGYYVISKGDFVYNPRISSESPYGPVHFYELEDDGIVSPLYLCFKTKNIESKFLKYFFMSSQWYKHIYTQGDSGARHDRVSIKDTAFFELKMAMPSLAEQEKISDFLTSLNLKVEKEKEKLMVLEEQKRGFMWGMFV